MLNGILTSALSIRVSEKEYKDRPSARPIACFYANYSLYYLRYCTDLIPLMLKMIEDDY